jgi:hypothetical protein
MTGYCRISHAEHDMLEISMAEKDDNNGNPGCEGNAKTPGTVSHCGNSEPGAGRGAGQDEKRELEWARRYGEEDPEGQPAPRPEQRPEPEPFVQEKFRKTELHDTPPVPELRDQVLRKNSLKYLAGQVDRIHDRLDTIEYRLDRSVARLDRRIEELEERWRWS